MILTVKLPPTNCPMCEALGPFRPRHRPIEDDKIEVYIRCTTCNWTQVLRVSTVKIEALIKSQARWEAYGRATRARHGVPSSLATAQVNKISSRLRELQNEIA
jgi:hypothetical protein